MATLKAMEPKKDKGEYNEKDFNSYYGNNDACWL